MSSCRPLQSTVLKYQWRRRRQRGGCGHAGQEPWHVGKFARRPAWRGSGRGDPASDRAGIGSRQWHRPRLNHGQHCRRRTWGCLADDSHVGYEECLCKGVSPAWRRSDSCRSTSPAWATETERAPQALGREGDVGGAQRHEAELSPSRLLPLALFSSHGSGLLNRGSFAPQDSKQMLINRRRESVLYGIGTR